MVERVVRDDEVAGSNPVTPIRRRRIEQWSRRTGEQLRETLATVKPAMVSPGEARHASVLAVDICCNFIPNAAAARREPSVVSLIELPTRSAICVHLWSLLCLGTLRVTR